MRGDGTLYRDRTAESVRGQGPRMDRPIIGHYECRLRRGPGGRSPWVPGRIYAVPCYSPEGELMTERPVVLACEIAGKDVDLEEGWIKLCAHPIDKAEYDYLVETIAYAAQYGHRDDPYADPTKPVDLAAIAPRLPPGV